MDTLIPAKYAGLALALKMLLDALIFLIPDRYLAAHTTEQLLVNALKRLLRPGVAALLLVALLVAPARADEPLPLAARPQAPVALSQTAEAAANACPEPCAACGQRTAAVLAPASQPMPTWLKAVIGVGVVLGGALTVYQQGHAAGTW